MPCSKNNKNNKNKNNKKQKYNCLTNSVSHCRNTKPTPTPPTPTNPPIYITPEKYDVICYPQVINPLQSNVLFNKLVRNIAGPDKLLSLLFQNPNQSYSSNYIFDFKHNFKLAFDIKIFQQAGSVSNNTRITGIFFVGTKYYPTPLINVNQRCFINCQYSSKVEIPNYEGKSKIDNTISKSFAIYENYQFSVGPITSGSGSITQSALTGSDPTLLGYVETQVGLPINLPFIIPETIFNLDVIDIYTYIFPVILTPRFYPLEPINNFLYQIESNKIRINEEYINEKYLAKVTGILSSKYQNLVDLTVGIFALIKRGTVITKEKIYMKKITNVSYYFDDLLDNAKINTVLEVDDEISIETTIKLDKSQAALPIQGVLRNELSFTVYK